MPLDFKKSVAFCIRKFLTKIVTPLTGFIQRQELPEYSESLSLFGKIKSRFIHWISARCSGAITFAYPLIPYDPIKLRREENQQEWASELLGISSNQLHNIATNFLKKTQSSSCLAPKSNSTTTPSFSILVCFHHHLPYFKNCLHSIEEALRSAPHAQVEILLINDDPSIDLSPFLASLDPILQKNLVFRSHQQNCGICNSLNEAIMHAQGEWLLHLDCDDMLESNVFLILEKIIREHPEARFISSRAIDIDIDNDILFWRLRSERSYELIENNFASHLKVIKKDLHRDFGLFKETFEGCQDYEFALRTAINEPILFIPHYLYRYRWHRDSQTVSHNHRQRLTAMRIRQSYMLAIYWFLHGTGILEWNITGPEAASWREACSSSSQNLHPKSSNNQPRYSVSLQATTPYDQRRWKLLLVEIATLIIDRYRGNDANISLIINI